MTSYRTAGSFSVRSAFGAYSTSGECQANPIATGHRPPAAGFRPPARLPTAASTSPLTSWEAPPPDSLGSRGRGRNRRASSVIRPAFGRRPCCPAFVAESTAGESLDRRRPTRLLRHQIRLIVGAAAVVGAHSNEQTGSAGRNRDFLQRCLGLDLEIDPLAGDRNPHLQLGPVFDRRRQADGSVRPEIDRRRRLVEGVGVVSGTAPTRPWDRDLLAPRNGDGGGWIASG